MPYPPPAGWRLPWRKLAFLHKKSSAPGRIVVTLRGEINAETSKRTQRTLLDALRMSPLILEVDLTHVTHVSTDGTLIFFAAVVEARSTGTRLVVTHPQAHVRWVLQRVGLGRLLTLS